MGKNKLDYPPGTKLNKLTVISEFTKIENSGRKRRFLQCKCDCGKLHSLIASDFKTVKSCGCIRNTSGGNWKVPEYRMLRCAQKRARERNIEFNISIEDISIPVTKFTLKELIDNITNGHNESVYNNIIKEAQQIDNEFNKFINYFLFPYII